MHKLVVDAGLRLQRDRYTAGPTRWRRPGNQAGRLVPPATSRSLVALGRFAVGPGSLRSLVAATATDRRRTELDWRSVADWLDDLEHSGSVRHIFDCLVGDAFGGGADLRDMSLLEFAELIGREGSGLRFVIGGWGLNSHIVEGSGALCAHLAGKLAPPVRLATTVTAIGQDHSGVAVRTHSGEVIEGDRAVIAVPTPTLASIEFSPGLPVHIQSANAGVRYGQGAKIAVVVGPRSRLQAKAFLGGDLIHAGWRTRRVLYGFAGADSAKLDTRTLVEDLCCGFDVDPQTVEHIKVVAWLQDQFTRGTYAYLPPGRFIAFRRSLPHRHGHVHFAGAERSSWPIYMEGAVESGENAADSIIALG